MEWTNNNCSGVSMAIRNAQKASAAGRFDDAQRYLSVARAWLRTPDAELALKLERRIAGGHTR